MIGASQHEDSPNAYVRECISSLEGAQAEQQASSPSPVAQRADTRSPAERTSGRRSRQSSAPPTSQAPVDADIAGWEAALKQAAGTHKTLVQAVIQYKQLLADSEVRLQQERASHRESIRQMSLMTAELKEKTAAFRAQEETMHSLRRSEGKLARLAGDQRQHIQELQAKLMDNLCEDLSRLPVQWQVTHDILKVVRETTKLLQQAEKRLEDVSAWNGWLQRSRPEQEPKQSADNTRLRAVLTQKSTGALQSALKMSGLCATVSASLVDSCLPSMSMLTPGNRRPAEQAASSTAEAVSAQAQTATLRRGPAGHLLRMAYGASGAGCGIALGFYKACSTSSAM